MFKCLFSLCSAALALFTTTGLCAHDTASLNSIDTMDAVTFTSSNAKGHVEVVPGKVGNALKFAFDKDGMNAMMVGHGGGTPEWDKAAGFSFWVKGDGTEHLGGLEFIWNGDYATRYAYAFPIISTEWKKVVVSWHDLIPEFSKTEQGVDAKMGNAPSKLSPIQFGKWWYWKDYAAHSYAIDDICLEPTIAVDTREFRPQNAPLARVLAKLKAGQPITLVTMGDSLTDANHWTNREHNWPLLLKAEIKRKYGSEVTIVNPAMGGTELRHNLIVMPRWSSTTPSPDLVTILFGFNDWSNGMRSKNFQATQQDAIDRVRRATNGKAEVLILTTCPSLENGTTFEELAVACRQAAKSKNAGLGDTYSMFQAVPQAEKANLYVEDKVHLSLQGQQRVAQTVLNALEKAGH